MSCFGICGLGAVVEKVFVVDCVKRLSLREQF